MRAALPLLAALLVAGCGGPKSTSDPAAQNVAEATSKGIPAAVAAGSCAGKPDFVPVYQDAKITSCTSGEAAGKRSGTILYSSVAQPTTILSWSREQALRAGLALRMEDGMSISTGDAKRTLRVMAMPGTPRNTVTVNWGVAN